MIQSSLNKDILNNLIQLPLGLDPVGDGALVGMTQVPSGSGTWVWLDSTPRDPTSGYNVFPNGGHDCGKYKLLLSPVKTRGYRVELVRLSVRPSVRLSGCLSVCPA